MLLALRATADNDRGPRYAAQLFRAWHQGLSRGAVIGLLFGRQAEQVGLACRCPRELVGMVRRQLLAAYPDCRLEVAAGEGLGPDGNAATWKAELWLRPDVFPLCRYQEFDDALYRNLFTFAGFHFQCAERG